MLENFQPNLNMFGSNVFSSIETGSMMKRSLPYNPETIHAVKYVGNKEDQMIREAYLEGTFHPEQRVTPNLPNLVS